jgi:hypothetical protein
VNAYEDCTHLISSRHRADGLVPLLDERLPLEVQLLELLGGAVQLDLRGV